MTTTTQASRTWSPAKHESTLPDPRWHRSPALRALAPHRAPAAWSRFRTGCPSGGEDDRLVESCRVPCGVRDRQPPRSHRVPSRGRDHQAPGSRACPRGAGTTKRQAHTACPYGTGDTGPTLTPRPLAGTGDTGPTLTPHAVAGPQPPSAGAPTACSREGRGHRPALTPRPSRGGGFQACRQGRGGSSQGWFCCLVTACRVEGVAALGLAAVPVSRQVRPLRVSWR
jgi:hypothetical protein